MENIMYQVSTLQALILGYSRTVINVGELIQTGDTGLGTNLPQEASFDTYSLKEDLESEIKSVE